MQVFPGEGDDESSVGMIKRLYGGKVKELYTDADSFEIQCQFFIYLFKEKVIINAILSSPKGYF